jgi:hypothetical protein
MQSCPDHSQSSQFASVHLTTTLPYTHTLLKALTFRSSNTLYNNYINSFLIIIVEEDMLVITTNSPTKSLVVSKYQGITIKEEIKVDSIIS